MREAKFHAFLNSTPDDDDKLVYIGLFSGKELWLGGHQSRSGQNGGEKILALVELVQYGGRRNLLTDLSTLGMLEDSTWNKEESELWYDVGKLFNSTPT